MKGLLKTSGVFAAFIAAGIITIDFNDRLAAAKERGYNEGYTRGYQTGWQKAKEVGYQEGSQAGYARANMDNVSSTDERGFYFLYNPTYDELRKILAEAETDSVREVHQYTETNGIRTAYVRAQIARQAPEGMVYIYQLVAFETVDRGLIIIEPWSHREVKVEVGQHYWELNNLPPLPHDDTITKITIVW